MKFCPNCGAQLNDNALFCPNCGTNPNVQQPNMNQQPNMQQQNPQMNQMGYYPAVPVYDPYDHTADFDPKDISENKVYAMTLYLLGVVGIIIALLAAGKSNYVSFHIRQVLKFTIVYTLVGIVTLLLVWTVIVPIVAGILVAVLGVVQIAMFFSICQGKAKEPVIIRSIGFLN